MDSSEIEKLKAYASSEIIGYIPDEVSSKTIIKKSTGSIRVISFSPGTGLSETTSPFDIFAQIIEGRAEMVIDKTVLSLGAGQSIIIPAHKPSQIKATEHFKMILTVIKSGYE
jgi:quercetin dioxygenase-like cupin family protein